MLTDKDLTLLLDLVIVHRKNIDEKTIASARRVYMQEADSIASELVAMRDAYRKSVATLKLAHNHTHAWTRSKPGATVETCSCGKWRHTENAGPSITEVR